MTNFLVLLTRRPRLSIHLKFTLADTTRKLILQEFWHTIEYITLQFTFCQFSLSSFYPLSNNVHGISVYNTCNFPC